jgi:hypothetical protein
MHDVHIHKFHREPLALVDTGQGYLSAHITIMVITMLAVSTPLGYHDLLPIRFIPITIYPSVKAGLYGSGMVAFVLLLLFHWPITITPRSSGSCSSSSPISGTVNV